MKKLLLGLLFLCSSAFADCDQLVAWKYPTTQHQTTQLCQIAFFTAWDPTTKNPAYSAEWLLKENVSGVETRKGSFKQHPNIGSDLQATNDDYSGSKYDRGHMAPAGDIRKNSVAMAQSFYLTNIVPQTPGLNRRSWKMLESYARFVVREDRPVYVVSGPIYSEPVQKLNDRVWIPSYTFKVIYDKEHNKVASYIMPNIPKLTGKIDKFYVPFSQVEAMSGVIVFPSMPPDVKATLIEAPLTKDW